MGPAKPVKASETSGSYNYAQLTWHSSSYNRSRNQMAKSKEPTKQAPDFIFFSRRSSNSLYLFFQF